MKKSSTKKQFSLVQKLLTTVFAGATLFATSHALAQSDEEKVLNIYHWSDYMAEDTISNFEKEYGIKVNIDYMDNNEILNAKLVAGRSGYDLVVPTLEWAKLQIDQGFYLPLDKAQLSNWKNYNPAIQEQIGKLDPDNKHLVDWMWGYVTVGINEGKVKAALGDKPLPENPWDLVFNPEYASKLKSCGISFLDSPTDILPAALHYMGKNPFSAEKADYDAAVAMLKKVRPNIRMFSGSGYIEELAKGNLCTVIGWSGDIGIARERAKEAKNGHAIRILVPMAGAQLMFDTMAIPKDAKHPKNAHLFINYILRGKVAADLTNSVFYANPNIASKPYVKAELANDNTVFLTDAALKNMYVPLGLTDGVRRMSARAFNTFKTYSGK